MDDDGFMRQYLERYPAFASYKECMSRAFLEGLSSFTIAFSGLYIGQYFSRMYLPYGKKSYVILPSLVASVVSYKVTSLRAKSCQDYWMVAEGKYTHFSDFPDVDD